MAAGGPQLGDGEPTSQDPVVQADAVDADREHRAPLWAVHLGREHHWRGARQGDRVKAQGLLGPAGLAQPQGQDRAFAGALRCVARVDEFVERAGTDRHGKAGPGDRRGERAGHLEGPQVEGGGVDGQVRHPGELLRQHRHRRDRLGGTLPDPRNGRGLRGRWIDLAQHLLDPSRVVRVSRQDDGSSGLHPRARLAVVLPDDERVDREDRKCRRHRDDRDDPPHRRPAGDLDRGERRRQPASGQRAPPDGRGDRGEEVGQEEPDGQRYQRGGGQGDWAGEVAASQGRHPGHRDPDDPSVDQSHPSPTLSAGHPAQEGRHGLTDHPADGDDDR